MKNKQSYKGLPSFPHFFHLSLDSLLSFQMLPSSLSSATTNNSTPLSSSSSSSSSSSNNNKTQKNMEEVWKDITINSLPTTPIHRIHNIQHPSTNSHFRGIIFQDFFNNNGGSGGGEDARNINKSSSSSTSCSQIKPPPATSTTEFQFFENEIVMNSTESQHFELQGNSSVPNLISGETAFDALANSSLLTSFGAVAPSLNHHNHKKRLPQGDDNDSLVDRRHKRMIKNRESAARSRARKQAYITELQLEVDSLTKENEMLRKQQRQMQLIEAPATQGPKKKGLFRSRSN